MVSLSLAQSARCTSREFKHISGQESSILVRTGIAVWDPATRQSCARSEVFLMCQVRAVVQSRLLLIIV